MPTYEYACKACNYKFEEFQSITAAPIKKCPKCGKLKVQRLISAGAGVIFKGSGFYETDYRSESYKSAAKADSTPAKSESKLETKSDAPAKTESKPAESKPAAKSESKPAASGKSKK
jgi:putative FmdB family regulatory protein